MATLYVGNLVYQVTKDEVEMLFGHFGKVSDVKLITDKYSGRPKGFGFIEIDDESAESAIEALHGTDFGGRILKVTKAITKEKTPAEPKEKVETTAEESVEVETNKKVETETAVEVETKESNDEETK